MTHFIFIVTPDSVRCIAEIQSGAKITFTNRCIECVRVEARNEDDARESAVIIQKKRAEYMAKLMNAPLQSIGQLG